MPLSGGVWVNNDFVSPSLSPGFGLTVRKERLRDTDAACPPSSHSEALAACTAHGQSRASHFWAVEHPSPSLLFSCDFGHCLALHLSLQSLPVLGEHLGLLAFPSLRLHLPVTTMLHFSLHITFSTFTHVVTDGRISVFFLKFAPILIKCTKYAY